MQYVYPMKPTRIHVGAYFDKLMADPNWVLELKYDGSRGMVYVLENGRIEIWNRHHIRISESRIPDIYEAIYKLNLQPGTVLDGEIYPRGVGNSQVSASGKFLFAFFDMIQPGALDSRQELLRSLCMPGGVIHLVEQAIGEAKREFFEKVWKDERAEGIVLKALASRRMDDVRQTRISPFWTKVLKPTKVVA